MAARSPPPALAVAALALLAAAACSHSSDTLRVAGTVEIREVRLSPLASGRLQRLLKDEGDSVRTGDTVAVLEQPGLDALIEQRRALADAAATRTAEIRAAEAGQSIQGYLLGLITREASKPSLAEMAARAERYASDQVTHDDVLAALDEGRRGR